MSDYFSLIIGAIKTAFADIGIMSFTDIFKVIDYSVLANILTQSVQAFLKALPQ